MVSYNLICADVLAAGMLQLLKADARRPVQLADDDALRTIDDKRAALRHQRYVRHMDGLLVGLLHSRRAKPELRIHGSLVSATVLETVHNAHRRLFNLIADELKTYAILIPFRREGIFHYLLKPLVLALLGRYIILQKITEGFCLYVY